MALDTYVVLANQYATESDALADYEAVRKLYTDAGLIARQARALGLSSVLLGGDGWDSPKLVEIGGAALEGAYFSNHYSVDDPSEAARSFVATYRKVYGADPDSIAASSYDAARMLFDAMRRAGSTEGRPLRDALGKTAGFAGVTGTITMDENRNPVKSAVVLKIENGRFRFAASVSPSSGSPPAPPAR